MSHTSRRRCLEDMAIIEPYVRPADTRLPGAVERQGTVRADLEQIFRTTYPRVVAVAARVLGSSYEAEDVAQEVFLEFARTSVPASRAPGWLAAAAAHSALNRLRSGRRRSARELRYDDGRHASPDVAETVVALDRDRQVRAALSRLPRRQAVALVLRHSGLTYAEVASVLRISPTSVGTTLRRAESALRKELDRHAPSD